MQYEFLRLWRFPELMDFGHPADFQRVAQAVIYRSNSASNIQVESEIELA